MTVGADAAANGDAFTARVAELEFVMAVAEL